VSTDGGTITIFWWWRGQRRRSEGERGATRVDFGEVHRDLGEHAAGVWEPVVCGDFRLYERLVWGRGRWDLHLDGVRVICCNRWTSGPSSHSSARIGPAEGEISLLERLKMAHFI
jgi:hypothetical protein